MKRIIFAVFTASALAGCATEPVPLSQAARVPPERIFAADAPSATASSTLVVTRDSGMLGTACYAGFYIDGILKANFDSRESAQFPVEPGEHILGIGDPGKTTACFIGRGWLKESSTIVKPGETKYYRIVVRMGEGLSLEPTTQSK